VTTAPPGKRVCEPMIYSGTEGTCERACVVVPPIAVAVPLRSRESTVPENVI
jgi:hypothetical protein